MTSLRTNRLELRQIDAADLEKLAALYADPEVMRYIGNGLPRSREDTVGRLQFQLDHWRRYAFGFFMAYRLSDGVFIGRCGLQHLPNGEAIELGYTFAKPFWGYGYATEAAKACADYAFDTWEFDRIVAITRPANIASQRVLEKVGFRFIKVRDWEDGPVVWYEMNRPD